MAYRGTSPIRNSAISVPTAIPYPYRGTSLISDSLGADGALGNLDEGFLERCVCDTPVDHLFVCESVRVWECESV